ncbi:hypothetical protein [Streptomyces sp. AS58]|uniref:hypothetical protein n=1 Tax=Streptomyces sp. AS58 TaxID=1519489 RepID=UPI000A6A6A76|nr:hypothetical protein [Streptomyces sp. AS58]
MKRRPPRTRRNRESRRNRRLRHAATFALLRGLAYGLGTGTAGLLVYWLQQYL